MRNYTIKKIQGAPDWSTIPVMPIDNQLWVEHVDITAQTQICWDDEAFYLRQEAVEANIRREESGPLAPVCDDSCLEFFIRPTERMDYFNIEINPNRAIYLGFGDCLPNLIRLQVPNVQELFDIQVEMTDKGWVLTYKVPFSFIRRFFPDFAPAEGNTYKCGDATVHPHYIAWSPIDRYESTFHSPEQFGCLTFGGY